MEYDRTLSWWKFELESITKADTMARKIYHFTQISCSGLRRRVGLEINSTKTKVMTHSNRNFSIEDHIHLGQKNTIRSKQCDNER